MSGQLKLKLSPDRTKQQDEPETRLGVAVASLFASWEVVGASSVMDVLEYDII